MPRRRPAGERAGDAPAAKPATYVLHAEPGLFGIGGGGLDVVGHWLGRILDLTVAASANPREVAGLRGRVLAGLETLRSSAIGSETRDVAEDAIVAALALGFHHLGGPVAARTIERATRDQGKRWTAGARASRRPATMQKQTEGETAAKIVEHLCHDLWRREPAILEQTAYIRATIKKIHSEVIAAMRPHIAECSLWAESAEGLADRMSNHVRTARKTFSGASKQIP